MNYYQPWNRQSYNTYLNSPKDVLKLVNLSAVCILVRIRLDLFKLLSVGILFRSTEFGREV